MMSFTELKGDKFVVTGGAGFIGSHLCEELVRQQKQVICIDDFTNGRHENLQPWWDKKFCRLVDLDITQGLPYLENVDTIFHLACSKCTVCRNDPYKDLMVNAWGSFRIFDFARDLKAKVIHVSTGSVFGGEPKSFYGVSKLAGEAYLRAFKEYHPDFRFSAVRIYHVYGPRQDDSDRGGVIPIFIRQVLEGLPITIHGDGQQVRHFTYVKDVVSALLYLAGTEYDQHYFHFLNNLSTSILELAHKIPTLMGKTTYKFSWQDQKLGDIRNFNVIRDLYIPFHKMMPLTEGLSETIAWYKERHEQRKLAV